MTTDQQDPARGLPQETGKALVSVCHALDLSRETFELASLLLANLDRRGAWPEAWRPAPLAAALAYGAARLAGAELVTQEAAARQAGTSTASLRRSLAALALNLDLDFGVQLDAHPEDVIR